MARLSLEPLEDRSVPSSARPGGGNTGVTNPTPLGLTPVEVQHAYGFDQIPALADNYNSGGAGQTIAIVMAGDHPSIQSDLHVFDQTFGLPDPSFVKLNQNGSATGRWPAVNASWAGEIALDVEWAHAIAPAAKIVLVEANSARIADLAAAINTARNYPGVSAVSMSWGLLQGPGMNNYESLFTTPAGHTPITFVASSLDNGLSYPNNLYWPSVSPNVLAVGGTSLTLNPDGSYGSEVGWAPSTGGVSTWFAQPAYQQGVVTQSTTYRTVPDVSYHADNTDRGFAVYSSVAINHQSGWFNAYGDSAGAPQWAALVTLANQQRAANGLATLDGASQVLPGLYALAQADQQTYYHDITAGSNGRYSAGPGYDLVTGLGTPQANELVPALAALTGAGASVAFPPAPATISSFASLTAEVGGGVELQAPHAVDAGRPPERVDGGRGSPPSMPLIAAQPGLTYLPPDSDPLTPQWWAAP